MPKPDKPPGKPPKPPKPPIDPPPIDPPVDPPPPVGSLPELPRVQVDITYVNPTGATLRPLDSLQFQEALNSSQPGDLIELTAGQSYQGSFSLPKKPAGAPVYVVSSGLGFLPTGRVGLGDSVAMPYLIAPDPTSPALSTQASAHDFRFVGINFGCKPGEANNGLVRLGTGSETAIADFPERIILDRCLVQGDPAAGGKRGVLLSGNYLAVIGSYLADWKMPDIDAQAVAGWTGQGPWRVENCHLEAAGEAFLAGGSDPLIANLVPSDLQITGNLFTKPMRWNPYSPDYDGSSWQCKNALELKNARRVLISGNRLEHNWAAAQSGSIILFTPKNQYGVAPWTVVEDVTFVGNWIAGTLKGIAISGNDGVQPSAGGRRILIQNNYFSELGGALWGEAAAPAWEISTAFALVGGMDDVQINHNTVLNSSALPQGAFIIADGAAYQRFKLTNNIWQNGLYGIKGGGTAQGNPTIAVWFPGAVVQRNVMISANDWDYPIDNFFPANPAVVGFVQYPTDVMLAVGSAYAGQAVDGTNPGAADGMLTS